MKRLLVLGVLVALHASPTSAQEPWRAQAIDIGVAVAARPGDCPVAWSIASGETAAEMRKLGFAAWGPTAECRFLLEPGNYQREAYAWLCEMAEGMGNNLNGRTSDTYPPRPSRECRGAAHRLTVPLHDRVVRLAQLCDRLDQLGRKPVRRNRCWTTLENTRSRLDSLNGL